MRACWKHLIVGLLGFVLSPAFAAEIESVAIEVPTAKMLVLENGDTVRLAAIQAPNKGSNGAPDDRLAEEAHAKLRELAMGKRLRLVPIGKKDRRGRIVAKAYDSKHRLIQAEMLKAGMGWAYTFPDTRMMAQELFTAEKEAENAKRGVWREADYQVLVTENAGGHDGEFRLVTGKITQVENRNGRYFVNFGADWKTDFTLIVEKKDAKRFDEGWLESLPGKTVRVRGWLFSRNGPAMELTHPEQVEMMADEK